MPIPSSLIPQKVIIPEYIKINKSCKLPNIPLPFISKIYKFFVKWKIASLETNKDFWKHSEKKQKLQEKLEEQERMITLSVSLEASLEACFQFWFQTIYLLPTLILGLTDIDGANEITDLIDYRFLSICLSFVTFAWASCTIR